MVSVTTCVVDGWIVLSEVNICLVNCIHRCNFMSTQTTDYSILVVVYQFKFYCIVIFYLFVRNDNFRPYCQFPRVFFKILFPRY